MVDKETGVILWLEHVCGSSLDCERFSEHFSGSFSAKIATIYFGHDYVKIRAVL